MQASELVLLTLVVRADVRRQGIGKALLHQLIQHASTSKHSRIVTDIGNSNETAWRFFHSMGFTRAQQPKQGDRTFEAHLIVPPGLDFIPNLAHQDSSRLQDIDQPGPSTPAASTGTQAHDPLQQAVAVQATRGNVQGEQSRSVLLSNRGGHVSAIVDKPTYQQNYRCPLQLKSYRMFQTLLNGAFLWQRPSAGISCVISSSVSARCASTRRHQASSGGHQLTVAAAYAKQGGWLSCQTGTHRSKQMQSRQLNHTRKQPAAVLPPMLQACKHRTATRGLQYSASCSRVYLWT